MPKKNGAARFVASLCQANKRIVRKLFPMPQISDAMQKLEGF